METEKNNNLNIYNQQRAFTLIELMVVILIVAILVAVAIPIMRGRVDAAKWSEGKSMAGTLAVTLLAYSVEKEGNGSYGTDSPSLDLLGFAVSDLTGTYFMASNYSWTTVYSLDGNPPLTFTITVDTPAEIDSPSQVRLNEQGVWTETL